MVDIDEKDIGYRFELETQSWADWYNEMTPSERVAFIVGRVIDGRGGQFYGGWEGRVAANLDKLKKE